MVGRPSTGAQVVRHLWVWSIECQLSMPCCAKPGTYRVCAVPSAGLRVGLRRRRCVSVCFQFWDMMGGWEPGGNEDRMRCDANWKNEISATIS